MGTRQQLGKATALRGASDGATQARIVAPYSACSLPPVCCVVKVTCRPGQSRRGTGFHF